MYTFRNDYSDGGHPLILKALTETASLMTDGYGEDLITQETEDLFKKEMACPEATVHFLAGGTLTNLTALAAFLRPHEAVIAADTGHINTHETGAIEATGHKIITAPSPDGKIRPEQIRAILTDHYFEHMVKPRLLYLSQTTETGTLYSRRELTELRELCTQNNLILFIDGARLGCALTAPSADLTLRDYAALCDAFYIGGTKNGALFGEALVITNPALQSDFRYAMKQRGALLAKGRLLAVQFRALFTDGLYYRLAEHSTQMAEKLHKGITEKGYSFLAEPVSNQIFPIFPESIVQELEKQFLFYRWDTQPEVDVCIRLVCSWATPEEAVDDFLKNLPPKSC